MALRDVQAMLPQGVRSHVPPFENLMVQSYPQLEASLADRLHKNEFVSLLVNVPLDITRARFCSCVGPRVGAWLLAHPTTPTFRFFTTLCTHHGLSHPIVAHLSWC
jgi:hypothetical protein